MEKKYIQLIHKDLDGLLTPSERQELDTALQADPELQKFSEKLLRMSEQLKQVPLLEPPPSLKQKIVESIDFNRYRAKKTKPALFSRFAQWYAEPRFRLVYGLAAGIIIGILTSLLLFPGLITQPPLQITDLYGTIGIHESDLNVIREYSVDRNSFQGAFKVKTYWNIVGCEISFQTNADTEIQLEYNQALLEFRGITTLESIKTDLKTTPNLITLSASQSGNFLILFEKLSPSIFPITLKINQKDKNIFTQTMTNN